LNPFVQIIEKSVQLSKVVAIDIEGETAWGGGFVVIL